MESPPIRAGPTRKTKTNNKVPGNVEDRDRIVVPTSLPRVSISFLKKKEKTLPKSSTILTIRKGITPTSILEI